MRAITGGSTGASAGRRLLLQLRQLPFERDLQHLVHLLDEVQLHLGLQQLGQIGQILPVFLGQNRLEDARAMCRQQLLLQAADWKHLAAQRDLAGHGDIAPHLDLRQRAGQPGSQRDAGRWTILRNRALRDVHMDVDVAVEVLAPVPDDARASGCSSARPAPTPASRRQVGRSPSSCPCRPAPEPRSAESCRQPPSTPDPSPGRPRSSHAPASRGTSPRPATRPGSPQ